MYCVNGLSWHRMPFRTWPLCKQAHNQPVFTCDNSTPCYPALLPCWTSCTWCPLSLTLFSFPGISIPYWSIQHLPVHTSGLSSSFISPSRHNSQIQHRMCAHCVPGPVVNTISYGIALHSDDFPGSKLIVKSSFYLWGNRKTERSVIWRTAQSCYVIDPGVEPWQSCSGTLAFDHCPCLFYCVF